MASVWAEFEVTNTRPVPLLDATPLQLWIYAAPDKKPPAAKSDRPNRKLLSEFYGETQNDVGLHLLVSTSQLISVQLDHYQLLFLLRLVDSLAEMGAFLTCDTARILSPDTPPGMVIAALIPQLDVSVVLPADNVVANVDDSNRDSPVDADIKNSTDNLPSVDMEQKFEGLMPVVDHSDPLSMQDVRPDNVSPACLSPMPEPPVKLQLQSSSSNGLFASMRSTPSSSKSRNLTSSFNSKMDGLTSGSYLSLGSGLRSPDLDMDSLSVRSDDSGDSSWQESEAGWTMVSDNMDIGEGLFKVSRNSDR